MRSLTIENSVGMSVNVRFPASPAGLFKWEAFSGVLADGTEERLRDGIPANEQCNRTGDADRDEHRPWEPALDRTDREGARRVSHPGSRAERPNRLNFHGGDPHGHNLNNPMWP